MANAAAADKQAIGFGYGVCFDNFEDNDDESGDDYGDPRCSKADSDAVAFRAAAITLTTRHLRWPTVAEPSTTSKRPYSVAAAAKQK